MNNLAELLEKYGIPDGLRHGLTLYLTEGYLPGSFLRAVLANDLLGAVNRGDPTSLERLPYIVQFLYSCAPIGSWGSGANVDAWVESHRARRSS